MPILMVPSSGVGARIPVSDARSIERSLHAAYAHQRLEEIIRAILEDALNPARMDVPPWADDPLFEAEFARAVTDMADQTTDLVAEQLAILLETAPPRLAMRLAAAPRFVDQA